MHIEIKRNQNDGYEMLKDGVKVTKIRNYAVLHDGNKPPMLLVYRYNFDIVDKRTGEPVVETLQLYPDTISITA